MSRSNPRAGTASSYHDQARSSGAQQARDEAARAEQRLDEIQTDTARVQGLYFPAPEPTELPEHPPCQPCSRCPACLPIHERLLFETALYERYAGDGFQEWSQQLAKKVAHWRTQADAVLTGAHVTWKEARRANSVYDAYRRGFLEHVSETASGIGLDPSKVSFVPREGFIETVISPSITVWLRPGTNVDEVRHSFASSAAMSTYGRVQQLDLAGNPNGKYEVRHQGLEALLRDMVDAQQREDTAAAGLAAARRRRDAEYTAAAAWSEAQLALYQQLVDDQYDLVQQLHAQLQSCLEQCAEPDEEEEEEDDPIIAVGTTFISTVVTAAAVAMVAGVCAVLLGQPFDTGSEVTQPPVIERPSSEPTTDASDIEELPAVEVPSIGADAVQLDLLMQQTLGITNFPDDDLLTFLEDADSGSKFLLGDVAPTYFTSYFSDPLTELGLFPGELGAPLQLDGHLTSVLRFDGPLDIGTAVARYSDQADLAILPTSPASASDTLVAVGLRVAGDLTDPENCAGRQHTFAFVAGDSTVGPTYVPNPSFPGDYFAGGNRFTDFTLLDCEPSSAAATFVDGQLGSATNGGGALLSVEDGQTSALFLLPSSAVPVDGDLRTIFFEAEGGFTPETTRYQAVPDQFTPAAPMADAMDTGDCDFVLGPPAPGPVPSPSAAPDDPSPTPTPTPSATASPEDGGGGGGAPLPGGGGAPVPGSSTSGGGTTTTGGDPDETDPVLVAVGSALAAMGAAAMAAATAARREEEDNEDGPPSGAGGTPGTTTRPTNSAPSADRAPARPAPEERRLPGPTGPPTPDATDPAVAEAVERALETARGDHRTALEALRERGEDASDLDKRHREMVKDAGSLEKAREDETFRRLERAIETAGAVRRATIVQLTVELAQLPPGERLEVARGRLTELGEDVEHLVRVGADRVVASGDKQQAMALWEADLRSRRIQLEVTRELLARMDVTAGLHPTRLGQLAERISGTNIGLEVDRAPEGRKDVVRRNLELQRVLDLAEYRRIAQVGTFTDGVTGERISGGLRQHVGAGALRTLADLLAEESWAPQFLTLFHHGDDRDAIAAEIDGEVARGYGHLDVLGLGPVDPTLYFHGVVNHLRQRLADLERWYQEQYLSKGDNWFTMAFNMGLGSWMRHVGEYFHDDPDQGRKVIERIKSEAETAIAALELAAGEDGAARLAQDADALALLESAGYARRLSDGTVELRIPDGPNRIQVRMQPLPGRSMLDIFSARTVAEVGLAGVAPAWAGAGFSRTAATLGTEVYGLRATAFLFEATVGAYAETGVKVLLDGDLDTLTMDKLRTLVTESMVNNAVGATGTALGRGAAARSEAYKRTAELFRHADPAVARARRTLAERIVRESLEIGGEASLTTAFNAVANGTGLTYEEFLANALASTLNKGVSNGHLHPDNLSPEFKRAFGDDGTATLAEVAAMHGQTDRQRAEMTAEQRADALARYDAVTKGDTAPTPDAIFLALLRGDLNWADMKVAMQDRPGAEAAQRVVASLLRKELVNGALPEARARAREAVLTIARDRRRAAMALPEGPQRQRALDELRVWFADEIGRIDLEQASGEVNVDHTGRGEDVIVPGSDKPDSDIDLSVRSEFMRRALAQVMREHIIARIEELGGEVPATLPTLARSLDTNFYYNVMERIPSLLRTYATVADLPVEVPLLDGTVVELSHAQVVEANSFALVLRGLDDAGRTQYARNVTADLSGDALTARQQQLQVARDGLERSRRELDAIEAEVRRERGPDADPLDVRREAEDRLYGQRMERLHEIEQQLDIHPLDDPIGRAQLRAAWERQLNTIKRDGIETYGDAANLMIVVVMVQMGFGSPVRVEVDPSLRQLAELQSPDGPGKRSIPELMQDTEWRLDGRLGEFFTRQQIDAMMRDQYMMLVEHAREFQHGHEDPVATMRAFFKYGERVFLGLSMKGEFSIGGENAAPLQTFWDSIAGLSKDPAALRARLEQLGDGDVGMGMRLVLERFAALPEMAGVLGDPTVPLAGAAETAGSYGPAAAGRAWAEIRQAAYETGGSVAVEAARAEVLRGNAEARAATTRALEEHMELSRFRPEDHPRATTLREELDVLDVRLDQLPRLRARSQGADPGVVRSTKERTELFRLRQLKQQELETLAGRKTSQPTAIAAAETQRLRMRLAYLDASREAIQSSPASTRARPSTPVRPSVAATDRSIDALQADLSAVGSDR